MVHCYVLLNVWQSGQTVEFTVRTTQPIQTYFYQVLGSRDAVTIVLSHCKFSHMSVAAVILPRS